jgi:hypothetical protein
MTSIEALEWRAPTFKLFRHNALVVMMIARGTSTYFALIVNAKIELKEVLFEEDLELMLPISCLSRVLGVHLKVIGNTFDFCDGLDRDGHQWAIAAAQSVAPTLEISKGTFCDLDPTRHKGWVYACLVLGYLTLEEDLLSRVKQVDLVILRRDNNLLFNSGPPVLAFLHEMSGLSYRI